MVLRLLTSPENYRLSVKGTLSRGLFEIYVSFVARFKLRLRPLHKELSLGEYDNQRSANQIDGNLFTLNLSVEIWR